MSEHIEVSNMSILPLACVGVGTLTVNVLFDAAKQTIPPNDYGIGVYIDGAYSTELVPTVNGLAVFTVALGGGTHSVDLWSSNNTMRQGAYVYSYSVDTGTAVARPVPTPTRRMLFICDSIDCGCGQNPATQLSVGARLRAVYPGRIGWIGTGGLALWDCAGNSAGVGCGVVSIADLAQRAVNWLRRDSPVAITREIWESLGANDALFGNVGRQSSANFGAMCGQLYDAIHTLDAGVRIYAQSPILTGLEGNVNGFAESIPAYRTAKSTAASGRGWVTFVNGTNIVAAGGLGPDGLHMSNAGAQGKYDGTGGQGGSINMRGVLGV